MEKLMKFKSSLFSAAEGRTPALSLILKRVGAFLFSLVLSLGGQAYSFSPFGVAAVAAADAGCSFFAAAGASIGYILTQGSLYSLRYIASMFACVIMTGALKGAGRVTQSRMFAPLSAFVSLFVTGLALAFSDSVTLAELMRYACEAITGAGAAYFIFVCRTSNIKASGLKAIGSKNLSVLIVVISLFLFSLSEFTVFGFSPARAICVMLVLICARYTHEAGGAIVGVCTGIAMSIAGDSSFIIAGYSFGGLLGGVFSQLGRLGTAAAFAVANGIICIMEAQNNATLYVLIEVMAVSLIFVAIPPKIAKKAEELLTPASSLPILDSVKNSILWRLSNAAQMTREVSDSLISVSQALVPSASTDASVLYNNVKSEVCDSCGLRETCYEKQYDLTLAAFNDIMLQLRSGDAASFANIPPHFASMCIRTSALCGSFNRFYREYAARQRASVMVDEIRGIVSDQFDGISYMLTELSEELNEKTVFDVTAAGRISASFEGMGLKISDVCCAVDKYGRYLIDAHVELPDKPVSKMNIKAAAESALGKKLEMPVTGSLGKLVHIGLKERPPYRTVVGSSQFTADKERVCGDFFTSFTCENGLFYAIICDGMGTGTKAAIGAALAAALCERLIKAGFGVEASVRAVNSALIVKSSDEQSVTLDIAELDLYSGQAVFYKAGAGVTLVKKKNRTVKIAPASLPLGILRECELAKASGVLSAGDIILMTTDGVGEKALEAASQKLGEFNSGEISAFAKGIAAQAKSAYGEGEKDDDISVLAIALCKTT